MADEPKKDDLDFLKEFSDVPPAPVMKRNRLGMSIQFFVVPSVIVGLVIAVFLLFRFMTEETQSLTDLLQRLTTATGHQKRVYMDSFIRKLHQERGDYKAPPSEDVKKMIPPILGAIRGMSNRELTPEEIDTKVILLKSLGMIGDPEVAADIGQLMDEEKHEPVQWEGLQTLGALRNPESIGVIRKYLAHSSGKMRKYAAFNLGALRNPEAIPDLKQHLVDDSIEVRWNSAFALAYFLKDASGVPVLLKMLDREEVQKAVDPKDDNRDLFVNHCMSLAAQALAVLHEVSAIPVLEKAAEHDPNQDVRTACRNALKVIKAK